ncbi:MAG TPA: PAS domain-containing protein, partial [Syntrophorhabdaceae bacterium]|nr:PAS domain-containing protein [Syntrophorhabdaceae bacterium]
MGQSSSNIRQVKVPELLTAQGNVIAYEWDTRAGTLNTWDPMEKPTLSCRHVYDRAFIDSLIHPDDRSRVLRKVKTGLRGRGRFEVEFRILTAPDKYVWVRDHGRTVSSEESTDGAVRGLFISVSSYQETIQELSSANATVSEKLRQSEEINNAILKSLEGFAHVRYLDPDLRIHWDNEEFTLERLSKNDLSALTH